MKQRISIMILLIFHMAEIIFYSSPLSYLHCKRIYTNIKNLIREKLQHHHLCCLHTQHACYLYLNPGSALYDAAIQHELLFQTGLHFFPNHKRFQDAYKRQQQKK